MLLLLPLLSFSLDLLFLFFLLFLSFLRFLLPVYLILLIYAPYAPSTLSRSTLSTFLLSLDLVGEFLAPPPDTLCCTWSCFIINCYYCYRLKERQCYLFDGCLLRLWCLVNLPSNQMSIRMAFSCGRYSRSVCNLIMAILTKKFWNLLQRYKLCFTQYFICKKKYNVKW